MRLVKFFIVVTLLLCVHKSWSGEKPPGPSHLMVGPGAFDFDRDHARFLGQIEYRWEVNCHHIRPLVAFFITTDGNLFLCGGVGYDIFIGRRLVVTPSFAPGLYYHGNGKHLGFPLNFRSAIEVSYVIKRNQGRFGIQCNHISNAHMLYKNPGANSLYIFYAMPLPSLKKKKSQSSL
jgi:lipid A 3-O-deacylase